MTFDLQAWNRQFNQDHPMVNDVLAVSDEGRPSYDCKGICALKAKALHDEQGYTWGRMTALTVPGGSPTEHHVVLLVDEKYVLNNLTAWLEPLCAYPTVLQRLPSWELCLELGEAA